MRIRLHQQQQHQLRPRARHLRQRFQSMVLEVENEEAAVRSMDKFNQTNRISILKSKRNLPSLSSPSTTIPPCKMTLEVEGMKEATVRGLIRSVGVDQSINQSVNFGTVTGEDDRLFIL